jgi:hypothetical protein
MPNTDGERRVADDILRGLRAIAGELGMTVRQTHYALTAGRIPSGRDGNSWIASRQILREHYRRKLAQMTAQMTTEPTSKPTSHRRKK